MPWLVVAARKGVSSFDATCSLVQRRWGDNMVEILKFSRETAFTPETIEILAAALDEVWERMRQSGSRLTRPAYSRVMREVVAKHIMEMAQRGVEDREALVADALRFIAANYATRNEANWQNNTAAGACAQRAATAMVPVGSHGHLAGALRHR